jgi:hypothetical protein
MDQLAKPLGPFNHGSEIVWNKSRRLGLFQQWFYGKLRPLSP